MSEQRNTAESATCVVCGEPLVRGQALNDAGTAHTTCFVSVMGSMPLDGSDPIRRAGEALIEAMRAVFLSVPAVHGSDRCVGKRCWRRAEFEIRTIDTTKGAHEYPVKLCRPCLTALDEDGRPVDIFRWLTDGRIEADR